MQITKLLVPACLILGFNPSAQANLSSTVTLTSNYLFNGITLTEDDPALQPSLDWVSDSGWYLVPGDPTSVLPKIPTVKLIFIRATTPI